METCENTEWFEKWMSAPPAFRWPRPIFNPDDSGSESDPETHRDEQNNNQPIEIPDTLPNSENIQNSENIENIEEISEENFDPYISVKVEKQVTTMAILVPVEGDESYEMSDMPNRHMSISHIPVDDPYVSVKKEREELLPTCTITEISDAEDPYVSVKKEAEELEEVHIENLHRAVKQEPRSPGSEKSLDGSLMNFEIKKARNIENKKSEKMDVHCTRIYQNEIIIISDADSDKERKIRGRLDKTLKALGTDLETVNTDLQTAGKRRLRKFKIYLFLVCQKLKI